MSNVDRAILLSKVLGDSFVLQVSIVEEHYVIDFDNGARLILEDFSVEED